MDGGWLRGLVLSKDLGADIIKRNKSTVFGGVISALSLVFMIISNLIPILWISLPAFSGIILVVIVIELGFKWGLLSYAAVSILSILILPDKETAILFVFFFGYYPVIKSVIESKFRKITGYPVKLVLFNVSCICVYYLVSFFIGINYLDEFQEFGKYAAVLLLVLFNIIFVMYDIMVTRCVIWYVRWFKPKYLNKL